MTTRHPSQYFLPHASFRFGYSHSTRVATYSRGYEDTNLEETGSSFPPSIHFVPISAALFKLATPDTNLADTWRRSRTHTVTAAAETRDVPALEFRGTPGKPASRHPETLTQRFHRMRYVYTAGS